MRTRVYLYDNGGLVSASSKTQAAMWHESSWTKAAEAALRADRGIVDDVRNARLAPRPRDGQSARELYEELEVYLAEYAPVERARKTVARKKGRRVSVHMRLFFASLCCMGTSVQLYDEDRFALWHLGMHKHAGRVRRRPGEDRDADDPSATAVCFAKDERHMLDPFPCLHWKSDVVVAEVSLVLGPSDSSESDASLKGLVRPPRLQKTITLRRGNIVAEFLEGLGEHSRLTTDFLTRRREAFEKETGQRRKVADRIKELVEEVTAAVERLDLDSESDSDTQSIHAIHRRVLRHARMAQSRLATLSEMKSAANDLEDEVEELTELL